MAAPSTVYKDFKTRRRKAGTSDVDIDLFIAKFLQNTTPTTGTDWGNGYFNSTDTEAEKIAKIKDIFKIDGWIQVAKGTATTPEMGFIGFCHSRTSGNGLYHNWDNNTSPFVARGSGVRVPTTVNANAELLNDAGLNRMPDSSMLEDNNPVYWFNWVSLKLYVRSAFYDSTSDYGYRYRINGGTWQEVSLSSTLAPKIYTTEEARGLILTGTSAEGQLLEVQAYATNAEGKKYNLTDIISEYLWEELSVQDMDKYVAANNPLETPTQVTIYARKSEYDLLSTVTESAASTGIYFYIADLCTSAVKAPSAYYNSGERVLSGGTYYHKMWYTDSNGQVTRYYLRDIPAAVSLRITIEYLYDMEMNKVWYANYDLQNITSNSTEYTITGTVIQRNSAGNVVATLVSTGTTIASGTLGNSDELTGLTYTASAGDYITVESVSVSPTIDYTSLPNSDL